MRNKTFYKEKAEAVKNEVLSIQRKGEVFNIDDPFNSYPGIYEAIREFTHIVYSFDKDLPLNKELDELASLRFRSVFIGGNANSVNRDFDTVMSKIDFFLHYLDTYVD